VDIWGQALRQFARTRTHTHTHTHTRTRTHTHKHTARARCFRVSFSKRRRSIFRPLTGWKEHESCVFHRRKKQYRVWYFTVVECTYFQMCSPFLHTFLVLTLIYFIFLQIPCCRIVRSLYVTLHTSDAVWVHSRTPSVFCDTTLQTFFMIGIYCVESNWHSIWFSCDEWFIFDRNKQNINLLGRLRSMLRTHNKML